MNEYEPFQKKKNIQKNSNLRKKVFICRSYFTFFKFANFNCGIMIRIHVKSISCFIELPHIFFREMRQGKRNNEWMDG